MPLTVNLPNIVLVHVTHELSGVDFLVFLAVPRALYHFPKQQGRHPNEQPEQHGLDS